MRLLRLAALPPVAITAMSIGGRLDARAGPSLSETFAGLAGLGVLNSTGCVINGDSDHAPPRPRTETERSCASHQQQVDAGLAQCVQRAQAASQAARDGSPLFQQYFKTGDANTRNHVAQFFAKIAEGCDKNGALPIEVECTPNEGCTLPQTGNMELAAVATIKSRGPGAIQLCRSAFTMGGGGGGGGRWWRRQNRGGGGCQQNLASLGDLLVHEMSHTTVAAEDVAYGKQNAMRLSMGQSLHNADSYALFAQDVSAGCGAGRGNGNQQPPPPNNGNGQDGWDNGDYGNDQGWDNGDYNNDQGWDNGDYRPDQGGDNGDYRPDQGGDNGDYRPDQGGDNGDYRPDQGGDNGDYRPDQGGDNGDYREDQASDNGQYRPDQSSDNGRYRPDQGGDTGDYGSDQGVSNEPSPNGFPGSNPGLLDLGDGQTLDLNEILQESY